jgi:hypothetical protein
MRSVVDKAALGRVFLRVIQVSLISIIAPVLHAYLHLHDALNIKISRQCLGTFKKAMLFRTSGGTGTNSVHAPRRHVKLLTGVLISP